MGSTPTRTAVMPVPETVTITLRRRDADDLCTVLDIITWLPPPRWDAPRGDLAAEIIEALPQDEARRLSREIADA